MEDVGEGITMGGRNGLREGEREEGYFKGREGGREREGGYYKGREAGREGGREGGWDGWVEG